METPGLKHNIGWELGNKEDGYLTGLSCLIRSWRALASEGSILDDQDDAAAAEWVRADDPIPHADLAELGALLITAPAGDGSAEKPLAKEADPTPLTSHALGTAPALHC